MGLFSLQVPPLSPSSRWGSQRVAGALDTELLGWATTNPPIPQTPAGSPSRHWRPCCGLSPRCPDTSRRCTCRTWSSCGQRPSCSKRSRRQMSAAQEVTQLLERSGCHRPTECALEVQGVVSSGSSI